MMKYHNWGRQRRKLNRQLPPPALPQQLIASIETTDFLNEDSRTTLCNMLATDLHHHIDIGMHCDYHYSLRPDLALLDPEDHDVDWDNSREIMPKCILGINLSAVQTQSRNRRKDNSSDESSSSNSSTGNDITGFVFMQLGRVFALPDTILQDMQRQGKTPAQMPWMDSGFVLVVAIDHTGVAGAPWLLFNFKPEDEMEGGRIAIPQSGRNWGILCGDWMQQRVGVKIGNRLGEPEKERTWHMSSDFGREYSARLVAAMREQESARGRLVRQKMFETAREGR